ncbi:MAG TPA: enolase C-terminal domain-like protein [Rhodanobacteraceae bacterium]|nr:enolase C-terminal domain-like protein [Rhodanobacteraceae bacterium]
MAAAAIDVATTVPVQALEVSAYRVPTDAPESDGTLAWNATTLVLVRVRAGGQTGIGYSYADHATATLIGETLADEVVGRNCFDITGIWQAMVHAIRNLGRPGIASMAVSAVDVALWDLKARLLQLPLVRLLGAVREAVPAYGSGGFTSYDRAQLQEQLGGWAQAGFRMVKMKVGREPGEDLQRVADARAAIGTRTELFVDANGGYARKQALDMAERFAEHEVCWFEEPVSSDDLDGLRLLRDRGPAGMAIAAGEYGYATPYFRRMLAAGAVDVLQADATRCGGITGFMRVAAVCESFGLPLSGHCAPSLHVHACCAAAPVRHLEYFHDHVRIEHLLFDGAPEPRCGVLRPDLSRPGLGLEFKSRDGERHAL